MDPTSPPNHTTLAIGEETEITEGTTSATQLTPTLCEGLFKEKGHTPRHEDITTLQAAGTDERQRETKKELERDHLIERDQSPKTAESPQQ